MLNIGVESAVLQAMRKSSQTLERPPVPLRPVSDSEAYRRRLDRDYLACARNFRETS